MHTISKLIERLFLSRIINHVENSPNFNRFQSAYRRSYSTETALLRLLNDVYQAADLKQTTLLVLLDLSAAFDSIDIPTLLRRLNHTFGLTNAPLRWIASYLNGRSQYVRIGTTKSQAVPIVYGVPQGSVLGPLLFSLYISPVAKIMQSHGVNFVQYADDTQLYIQLDDSHSQLSAIRNCFNSLLQWFTVNGLQLNADKSETVQLGTAAKLRANRSLTQISLNENKLKLSSCVRNLGVLIDSNLSFTDHVNSICKSARFHISSLRQIRNSIDTETAKEIASSIVGSRLDYCNSVLHGVSNTNIHKLQLVQNALARVVMRSRKYEHITPLLCELHWLPIRARIDYKIAVLTHKILTTNKPAYLSELLYEHHQARQLRSSAIRQLSVPRVRTQFGARAFQHAAPTVWNSLPSSLTKDLPSLWTFKQKLKTYYFKQSFSR